MKYILIVLLFVSCNKKSLFESWSNPIQESRKLNLRNGHKGHNPNALQLNDDCHLDIKVEGREDAGFIHVVSNSQDCQGHKVPTQMMYQANGDELKLCSDYKDGSHVCENMIKN